MNKSKKRKSGHDFRCEKRARLREESAATCVKITDFCKFRSISTPIITKPHETPTICEESELATPTICEESELSEEPIVEASFVQEKEAILNEVFEAMNVEKDLKINQQADVQSDNVSTQSSVENNKPDFQPEDSNAFFKKPLEDSFDSFFSYHPIQLNRDDTCHNFPFDFNVFYSKQSDGQLLKRNWLSYNKYSKLLYCTMCLAFTNGSSIFCQGYGKFRHLTQTLGEHEKSKSHVDATKSYVSYKQGKTLDKLLLEKQKEKRKKEVLERRQVLSAIIDTIKLIGKQGLAFRASEEGAYTLVDPSINHGNFLEILLLVSKYNECLYKHIQKAIRDSQKIKENEKNTGKKNKGRGSHITFLSKTTIIKIIAIVKSCMRSIISNEIREARQFSVLMDTTTDVSSVDQCVIVVRYLFKEEVKEKLLSLKAVHCTTGSGLFTTLTKSLENAGLSVSNCIANSFDGAANMSGEYNSVSSRLREAVPHHIHTWCYAHVLNLVMSDCTQSLTATISLFSLLQETQVFLKESHKRMNVYLACNPTVRLAAIGVTRWRSKTDALWKIFGRYNLWFDNEEHDDDYILSETVYVQLIISLHIIRKSNEFNSKIRNEADSLMQKFLSFETVLTAMVFLLIFKSTTPLSDYLQTKNLDYAQAWTLVSTAETNLCDARHKFSNVIAAAKKFVTKMNDTIDRYIEGNDNLKIDTDEICVELELPKKRTRKKTIMPGELAKDEDVAPKEEDKFRINIFNVVMDTITQSMKTRFSDQKNLYLDFSCFDPRNFGKVKTSLHKNALTEICSLIPTVEKNKLSEELQSFAEMWPKFSLNLSDHYGNKEVNEEETDSDDSDD